MNTLWKKIVAVLAIIGLVGCGQSKQTQPPSAPAATEALQAVVSFSVLADIVQQIGGERVQVVSLVGVGKNPHAFEPAPNDLKTITQAKLLVVNGLGFEGWLNRATDTAQFKGVKVVATQGVPALESPKTNAPKHGEAGHDHEHDHGQNQVEEQHDEHEHGAYDPHVWLSPQMVAKYYVPNILAGLKQVDPAGADYYQQRADAYLMQLNQLNERIKQDMSTVVLDKRKAVVSHSAFNYFGQTYGVTFYSAQGVSTESQPSAKTVAQLIELIKHENIRGVFLENISDPRLMAQIAQDTGVNVGGKLFTGALSEADGSAPTYLKMMEYNAKILVEGMK